MRLRELLNKPDQKHPPAPAVGDLDGHHFTIRRPICRRPCARLRLVARPGARAGADAARRAAADSHRLRAGASEGRQRLFSPRPTCRRRRAKCAAGDRSADRRLHRRAVDSHAAPSSSALPSSSAPAIAASRSGRSRPRQSPSGRSCWSAPSPPSTTPAMPAARAMPTAFASRLPTSRTRGSSAKGVARALPEGIDTTPTSFFADSPAFIKDPATDAYIKTCQARAWAKPLDPPTPTACSVSALVNDAIQAYNAGNTSMRWTTTSAPCARRAASSCACSTVST